MLGRATAAVVFAVAFSAVASARLPPLPRPAVRRSFFQSPMATGFEKHAYCCTVLRVKIIPSVNTPLFVGESTKSKRASKAPLSSLLPSAI